MTHLATTPHAGACMEGRGRTSRAPQWRNSWPHPPSIRPMGSHWALLQHWLVMGGGSMTLSMTIHDAMDDVRACILDRPQIFGSYYTRCLRLYNFKLWDFLATLWTKLSLESITTFNLINWVRLGVASAVLSM